MQHQPNKATESLRPMPTPEFPWSVIAPYLFDWQGETYSVTVDYYSKFLEVDKLMNTSSESIGALKDQICHHGIPEQLHTDNSPQYTSQDFATFCKSYGIEHTTSSPDSHSLMEKQKGQFRQLKGYGTRVKTKLLHFWTIALPLLASSWAVISSAIHGTATKEQDSCDKRTPQTSSHRPPRGQMKTE